MEDDKYLRNEKGEISMMPLITWNIDKFDVGIFAQLLFAATPDSLAKGELDCVQLAISPEQALKLADRLETLANRVLRSQGKTPSPI
ncbi:hypothetical protein HDF16_000730 [Granulicella aggregans]|uniref:Uncharacterized protein n=1 Tax=Granulicella aggregans TaxID=474949 RepID=A0A7W7Z9Y9_9BACT|nr:hypothetical protein [Granulicella aggregans]MBB5056061.1 hypothetical protein [Granulicella aggregans]